MKPTDLIGKHILQGIEICAIKTKTPYMDDEENMVNAIKFELDGKLYVAVEDPDDGYRSYLGELQCIENPEREEQCKTRIPNAEVLCLVDYQHPEIILFYDVENGELIMRIGTDYSDDYYPVCVMNYFPERLSMNGNRREDTACDS